MEQNRQMLLLSGHLAASINFSPLTKIPQSGCPAPLFLFLHRRRVVAPTKDPHGRNLQCGGPQRPRFQVLKEVKSVVLRSQIVSPRCSRSTNQTSAECCLEVAALVRPTWEGVVPTAPRPVCPGVQCVGASQAPRPGSGLPRVRGGPNSPSLSIPSAGSQETAPGSGLPLQDPP